MSYINQKKMNEAKACLDEMMESFIEFGKPKQISRAEKVSRYIECLKKLGNHYSNFSEANSALYKAIPEHRMFPRFNAITPMAFRDARDYEARIGQGGIVTGYSKFQSWAFKHPECFINNCGRSTDNNDFYGRDMNLSYAQIKKFITKMEQKHPLDRKVRIIYNLHPGIIKRGETSLLGMVVRKAGCDEVKVYVNTDQAEVLVLKTIAHEYRHIMQWENHGMEWLTTSSKIRNKETDAHIFGNRVVRELYYKNL